MDILQTVETLIISRFIHSLNLLSIHNICTDIGGAVVMQFFKSTHIDCLTDGNDLLSYRMQSNGERNIFSC